MSEIRGSVAGATYSSSRTAAIRIGAKQRPVLKHSNHATKLKAAWAYTAQKWATLPAANKTRWQILALNYVGEKGKPLPTDNDAGRRLMMASLAIQFAIPNIGLNPTADAMTPPAYYTPYRVGRMAITYLAPTTATLRIDFATTAGFYIQVYRLGPFNQTCNSQPRGFNSKGMTAFTASSNNVLSTILTGLISGKRYFFRIRVTFYGTNFYCPAGTYYLSWTQP